LLAGILAKATAVYEFDNKPWIQVIDPPNEEWKEFLRLSLRSFSV